MNPFWIKVNNWGKHNPRKDVKKPSWFAFENRMIEDEDFFSFTHGEFKVWIYILSKASQKVSPIVRIVPEHADRVCRISFEEMQSGVGKLVELGIISTNVSEEEIEKARSGEPLLENVDVQNPNVDVQNAYATGEDRGGQDRTEQDRGGEGQSAATHFNFGSVSELANCPDYVLEKLQYVPQSVQKVWVDTWELSSLKPALAKITTKLLAKGKVKSMEWASLYSSWLWSERPPLKKKHRPMEEAMPLISKADAHKTYQAQLERAGVNSFTQLIGKGVW